MPPVLAAIAALTWSPKPSTCMASAAADASSAFLRSSLSLRCRSAPTRRASRASASRLRSSRRLSAAVRATCRLLSKSACVSAGGFMLVA